MKTKTTKAIQLKSGVTIPEGKEVVVLPMEGRDSHVQVITELCEKPIAISATIAHRFFEEFIPITMETLEEASYDSCCPSLTGEEVEPDGYDSEGFPSVLLAIGMI